MPGQLAGHGVHRLLDTDPAAVPHPVGQQFDVFAAAAEHLPVSAAVIDIAGRHGIPDQGFHHVLGHGEGRHGHRRLETVGQQPFRHGVGGVFGADLLLVRSQGDVNRAGAVVAVQQLQVLRPTWREGRKLEGFLIPALAGPGAPMGIPQDARLGFVPLGGHDLVPDVIIALGEDK